MKLDVFSWVDSDDGEISDYDEEEEEAENVEEQVEGADSGTS